ncbi:hypothetical protein [Streptomyces coriariae]|uniref:hypothetical protein n=1 Tax=Streptomyces coriariae TaxID=2864460 RepID=UPI001E2D123F|nr:hypothetical protein [Streptomyces coriariae]
MEGEATWVGVAEAGLTEAGLPEAGLAEALGDSPEPHPVTTRAAEATAAAITEPRIPNLFQRMFPFPFLFAFLLAFLSAPM